MIERRRYNPYELEQRPDGLTFGHYFPDNTVLNDPDSFERTGIRQRFVAQPSETTLFMGAYAANEAMQGRSNLDLLIATTSYPTGEHLSTAIADKLMIKPRVALDVYAACSGFAEALSFIKENEDYFERHNNILIVSSELYSPTLVDQDLPNARDIDPSRAQKLFSDGAMALNFSYGKDLTVMSAHHRPIPTPEGEENPIRMPIREDLIKNLQSEYILRSVPYAQSGYFEQNGRMVLKTVAKHVPELVQETIDDSGIDPTEITLEIPHQGSGPVVDVIARRSDLPVMKDVADGNFSSASIPKAMKKALEEGHLKQGDFAVLAGFGAGLFASASVVKIGS